MGGEEAFFFVKIARNSFSHADNNKVGGSLMSQLSTRPCESVPAERVRLVGMIVDSGSCEYLAITKASACGRYKVRLCHYHHVRDPHRIVHSAGAPSGVIRL